VAEAKNGGSVEVWGDGTAVRSYTYIDDMVEGIYLLMQSDLQGAVNIGCPQYATVDELAVIIAEVSGKKIAIKHVKGPVGVQSRNFSNERIYSLGWKSKFTLRQGIELTYPWIEQQVKRAASSKYTGP
jgi:nucleoside-diphosphate-sugar epimerase